MSAITKQLTRNNRHNKKEEQQKREETHKEMEKGCDVQEMSKISTLQLTTAIGPGKFVIKRRDQVRHHETTPNFYDFLLWSLN